ncbi:hypothetical protein D3C87_1625750 [compost metagenome]
MKTGTDLKTFGQVLIGRLACQLCRTVTRGDPRRITAGLNEVLLQLSGINAACLRMARIFGRSPHHCRPLFVKVDQFLSNGLALL